MDLNSDSQSLTAETDLSELSIIQFHAAIVSVVRHGHATPCGQLIQRRLVLVVPSRCCAVADCWLLDLLVSSGVKYIRRSSSTKLAVSKLIPVNARSK